MGRKPCCEKVGLKRGPWAVEEDKKLVTFINTHGISCWRVVPKLAGLLRCGKSCRLRWTNYLRPDLKRGTFTEAEENLILKLHATLGNRWSRIALQLPGRTDNEIKNYWNTRLKKRLSTMDLDPTTHKPVESSATDGDTETVDGEEEITCSATPTSQNSESSPDESLVSSQTSEEVAAQLTSFESKPGGNLLVDIDMTPNSLSLSLNPKQSISSLQSSSSDIDVKVKHEDTSNTDLLENIHVPDAIFGVEDDDSCMENDLHPHARHLKQMTDLLNSRAHEHEPKIIAASSESGGLTEELAGSCGILQDSLAGGYNLLRQTSTGFSLSDMALGNWSFFGEVHGQSSGYGATSSISSWNDIHGFVLQPPGGRPSQEPELQKLAAILDQI